MTLEEKLLDDMKAAMKSGDKLVLDTLRVLRAELKNASIAKGEELSEEEIVGVLSKEAKRRRESLESFEKGGRQDLVEKEKRELELITSYLPEPFSEEELDDIVQKAVGATGAESLRDMGKVMGVVMPQIKGRADGKLVQELVKKKLS